MKIPRRHSKSAWQPSECKPTFIAVPRPPYSACPVSTRISAGWPVQHQHLLAQHISDGVTLVWGSICNFTYPLSRSLRCSYSGKLHIDYSVSCRYLFHLPLSQSRTVLVSRLVVSIIFRVPGLIWATSYAQSPLQAEPCKVYNKHYGLQHFNRFPSSLCLDLHRRASSISSNTRWFPNNATSARLRG